MHVRIFESLQFERLYVGDLLYLMPSLKNRSCVCEYKSSDRQFQDA